MGKRNVFGKKILKELSDQNLTQLIGLSSKNYFSIT